MRTREFQITDEFVSAWKKIMYSHWWGGGLWWVSGQKKEMLPLTYAEKEALATLLAPLQPQVNAYRDSKREAAGK